MALFFDLSIPYLERDGLPPPPANKPLWEARLRSVARAMELGYVAVAYDRSLRGALAEPHHCRIAPLRLDPLLERAPALASSAALHRDRLGAPADAPFRQFTRVTVLVDGRAAAAALASARPILRSYDIVAARPTNQEAFNEACTSSDIDLIAIDFSQKVPFRLKLSMVEAAVKRGVYFEITYSHLIADVHVRRQMLSDARVLVDWTRGKNLIISSAAATANELRGPYDVANLSAFLLGLSMERAKAAISRNCRSLVASTLRKKHCYKDAIRIERILPDKQPDLERVLFGNWNNWDPISSGDGDLPPLEKLSAASKPKNSVAISFMPVADETSSGDGVFHIGDGMFSPGNKETTSFGTLLMDVAHFKPQIIVGECDLVPTLDVALLRTDTMKADQIVIKDNNPRYLNGSDMVCNETRMLSGNLEDSIFVNKDHMVPQDANMIHSTSLENNQVPEICMEGHNSSDEPDVNPGAAGILQVDAEFQECIASVACDQTSLIDVHTSSEAIVLPNANVMHPTLPEKFQVSGICVENHKSLDEPVFNSGAIKISQIAGEYQECTPNAACNQTSLNYFQASLTPREYNIPMEQVRSRTEGSDQKREVSCPIGINLQTDFVERLAELGEMMHDMPMAHTYKEIQEKEKGQNTLVENDAQLEDPVVKIEQEARAGAVATNGARIYKLKKGKRRREERSYPVYPLPMKSLLKPMLFKNVRRFRRLRKHK